jgi:Subtilase family
MREYVVVAPNESSIDSLHQDLTSATVNKDNIPDRVVSVADPRELNERITHYYLSDAEAETLAKDPRVEAVHLNPSRDMAKHFTTYGKMLNATESPIAFNGTHGTFNRTAANPDAYNVNWGLRRSGLNAPELVQGSTYVYDEDATGVDIVIMDDGVQPNHPEFLDSSGISRLQQINWYSTSPTPGVAMPTGFYDLSIAGEGEHGTHVAGIAAGKNYGYAKGAKLYSMRIFDNTAGGTKSFTNSIGTAFDLIKYWHNAKPNDISTGRKRPTIVNMSWGYAWYYSGNPNNTTAKVITNITYRGVAHNYTNKVSYQTAYGQVGGLHGFRVPSVDAQIADGMAAGIIYVAAAGNYGHKVDVSSGLDFNNYYKSSVYGINPPNTPTYYHRGSSPQGTIQVSAGDYVILNSNGTLKEQLATYSERGPGCDVISPGTYITSSTSNLSTFAPFAYNFGTQAQAGTFKACKISGTSMATPQVTGVCALHLARHPETTPAQMKTWLTTNAKKNLVNTTTTSDDWLNSRALLTGPNNYLYNPYHNGFTD